MKVISIDIETYSDQPLAKTGVYRYVESSAFEILLFAYSVDGGEVQVVDLACGETIPGKVIEALEDEEVIKWAFNATFERVCLSRYLGYPTGDYLKPDSWRCSTTVSKILRNYCYTGNLLLQKTFCEDYMTKHMIVNTGQRPRYHAEETHEAIIPMEEWQAVQDEIERRANKRKATPLAKATFFYTGLIQCAKCGKNFRRKTTITQVVWICGTYNTRGKKYCASKQIPESTLDALVAEVVSDPTDIQKIIADDGNTLHFHLADGSVVTRIWADRSRAESWTGEMREKASQRLKERRQAEWQEQSQ